MDVSNFFGSTARELDDEPEIPAKEPAEELDVESLSPVQRLRAFRDGVLTFPDIAGQADDTESPPDTPADDDDDDDPGPESADRDSGDVTPSGDEGDKAVSEDSGSPVMAWIKQKKVLLGCAGALLAAGIIANLAIPHKHDSPAKPPQSDAPAAAHTATPPTATPGDKPIMPTGADVKREECLTGSTPPMDAFTAHTTEKNKKAWVCQTPFGAPGTTMIITLPGAMNTISAISSIPGYDGADQDGKDDWPRYRLVSSVIWYFDDGSWKQQNFTPERKQQPLKFDTPKYTKTIRLSVLATTDAPPSSHSPTTTSSAPGLLGDLGDWGKSLGGGDPKPSTAPASPSPAAPTTATPQPAGPSAFAMGGIQIIGHTSR